MSVAEAARGENVSNERVSRLCSRAIALFARTIDDLTRIGRPHVEGTQGSETRDLLLIQSLLDVTTSLLTKATLPKRRVRALIVGSWLRLKKKHPQITQGAFCKAVGITTRCLRNWLNSSTKDKQGKSSTRTGGAKKDQSQPNRGKFSFKVTLPDTQVAADTTDILAFGVPLKLVAAQDVGGRDQDLFDAILVDEKENAELVSQVLIEALSGLEGAQVITDQGTPYLAAKTREQLDQLDVEHAPQREADPTAKATIERAFGTIKSIAAPLLRLTDRIADAIPSLRDAELAKSATTVVLTALLRAYQTGARAARRAAGERDGADLEDLVEAAKQSRENARAEWRSERMLLTRIHGVFEIQQPLGAFIRSYRHYPLEVIQGAVRAVTAQAHRADIERRDGYFFRVVENCHAAYRKRTAKAAADRQTSKRLRQEVLDAHAAENARDRDPTTALRQALDLVATQWSQKTRELLFDGAGLGKARMRQAVDRLVEIHGLLAAGDIATGVLADFRKAQGSTIGEDGVDAVRIILEHHLGTFPKVSDPPDCSKGISTAIGLKTGPPTRPAPPPRLRT